MARSKIVEFYTLTIEERDLWIEKLKRFVIILDVRDEYKIGQMIGNGNFAKVHACMLKKNPSQTYALKTVGKSQIKQSSRNVVSTLLVV